MATLRTLAFISSSLQSIAQATHLIILASFHARGDRFTGMKSYSDLVERAFLDTDLLQTLCPSEPRNRELLRSIQEADEQTLSGGKTVGDARMFARVRGGLFYALDALDEAHVIFQQENDDLSAYWHGMMHRREGDFENARYWFRRAGVLPVFDQMHHAASEHSADMAKQANWDPYLFTWQCEQARFGANETGPELAALQLAEFQALFDYCWRKSELT
jgi:hypothetical protein